MTIEDALAIEKASMSSPCVLVNGFVTEDATVIVYDQYPSEYSKDLGVASITRRIAVFKKDNRNCVGSLVLTTRPA